MLASNILENDLTVSRKLGWCLAVKDIGRNQMTEHSATEMEVSSAEYSDNGYLGQIDREYSDAHCFDWEAITMQKLCRPQLTPLTKKGMPVTGYSSKQFVF